jgi:hypothetical protein
MWAGPRGGAAFTAAAMTLLHLNSPLTKCGAADSV